MKRREYIKSMALGYVAPCFVSAKAVSIAELLTANKAGHIGSFNEQLWFNKPAKYWNSQALHIGNGFLGLSFLGGVNEECFAITDKTLWTGGPGANRAYNYGIVSGGNDYITKIRQLILTNQVDQLKLADQLCSQHFFGDRKDYGYFSSFGRLSIMFNHDSKDYTHYTRFLDLTNSTARINYRVNNIAYQREYFCSYPDRVACIKFSCDKKNRVSINLAWNVFQQQHNLSFQNDTYLLSGRINGNGRQFCVRLHLKVTNGQVSYFDEKLVVTNADTVEILLAAGTEYKPIPPLYNGIDPQNLTTNIINSASSYGFSKLRERHIADYRKLYDRVHFSIPGNKSAELLATDERWKNYRLNPNSDPGIKVLYFNLSRYLLISSSRPGSLPANLQGGWNMFEAAMWSGNYQSNINLQLNYTSAAPLNLLECQEPYIDWIGGLVMPGQSVAQAYYGSKGWVSHAIGNIWGYAAPGFELSWGLYPAAAAWHCHFIWKHFTYAEDYSYLKNTGYPIMKGAAEFWLQNLIKYKGYLISAPSGSAEHGAFIEDGKLVAAGNSSDADIINIPCNFQDMEMIHELFSNTIQAAEALNADHEFVSLLKHTKENLTPLKIGENGQLQEWEEDIDSGSCNHRHIGHLYGLWPARQINHQSGKLAQAAKKTLTLRGDEPNYHNNFHKDIYTGANWSLALRMACWIRLREPENANKLFTKIITKAGFENLMTFQHVPESKETAEAQPDIEFFTHAGTLWYPVWQADTSLALAGLIAEMLVQTDDEGTITLLPALPSEWPEGKIKGLKTEGNMIVDLEWRKMRLVKYAIYYMTEKRIKVAIDGVVQEVYTKKSDAHF